MSIEINENSEDELNLDRSVVITASKGRQSFGKYHRPSCGIVGEAKRRKTMPLGEARWKPYQPAKCCQPDEAGG